MARLVCGILCIFLINVDCYTFTGRIQSSYVDGVAKLVVYNKNNDWVVKSAYNNSYLQTGWDILDIKANPEASEDDQAYLAGMVEGAESRAAIYDHWYNTLRLACANEAEVCDKINQYLDTNTKWVKQMIDQHKATDVYWKHVGLFYLQLQGMIAGYNSRAPLDKKLTIRDFQWLNFNWDFDELISAYKNESNRSLKGNGHCSALIKIVQGQSDILVAHNTWLGYSTMMRIMKRYTLPFQGVAGSSMSFSSYPGAIASGDDFYIINSGLVAQETTNYNNNNSLYTLIDPVGQVPGVVRVTVANRLADGGRSWAKIFSKYNSGTSNNQWMIVDMKKFEPRSVKPELLWIVEQVPGYIRQEDQTDLLLRQGYWASYNRPFYPDIFNMSGYSELVKNHGDYFSYDKTSRALIFERDHKKVKDVDSMMGLMRYNDFEHDTLSRCDCEPPYSADNTIAARSDLNPRNGTYPFPALSHRPEGATDAKVTSYQLSKNLSMMGVSGPSTGTSLPPFQWSLSDYNHQLSHRGHPDLFNFQPLFFTWPDLFMKSTTML